MISKLIVWTISTGAFPAYVALQSGIRPNVCKHIEPLHLSHRVFAILQLIFVRCPGKRVGLWDLTSHIFVSF